MKRSIKPYIYNIEKQKEDNEKIEKLERQIEEHSSFINDIFNNPTNNILITNLNNKKDISEVVNNHKDELNFITFNTSNNITDFNINQLYTVKNKDYINLVKLVWGTDENTLINIFKNYNINEPLSGNVYISNIFVENNNIITDIFNINNNFENRNTLNKARSELLNQEEIRKNYHFGEKHLFLSEIILKKYVFFFYNHDINDIENLPNLFFYEYFLNSLKNLEEFDLKTITKNAAEKFSSINEDDDHYKKLKKLRELLVKMFNNDKFRYKNIIYEIKNYFKDNNNIKTYKIVQYLFINDLIKLGLNFDFNTMVNQYIALPDNIKIIYEIIHNRNNMIVLYKKNILDKLIKNRQDEMKRYQIEKKTAPFLDPIIYRFILKILKQKKSNSNKDNDSEQLINQIENIVLDEEDDQKSESVKSNHKSKLKDKRKKSIKKDKSKKKNRSKSINNKDKHKEEQIIENDESDNSDNRKSKKINRSKNNIIDNEDSDSNEKSKPKNKKRRNKSGKSKSKSKDKYKRKKSKSSNKDK